jgi:aryl-alcohol dehydrogenase-like predicted oxidoreductase
MICQKSHRRDFLKQAAALGLALGASRQAIHAAIHPTGDPEWRNKQPEMAYRRLGRTGIMVSEVVSGGDPIRTDNYEHLNLAVDMGLNYLDMAPSYSRGDCETAYGKLLAGRSSVREKVFLTTKISGYSSVRYDLYKEIFETLPDDKKRTILGRANEMLAERGAAKPGYFLEYFPGQKRALEPAYLSNAMAPDYAHKVDGNPRFRRFMIESIEGSLKRVGTDYFDIVMCPHGANSPEELDTPEIYQTFLQLKKQGKVRFLGVTAHNDPAGVLKKAVELGHYDVAMVAYNIINGGYVEDAIRLARAKDVGVIAMKVAMAVATHHQALQPTPQWRVDKVNRIVPGSMKPPLKAYTWTLQNPNVSAVISNLWDQTFIRENLSVAGKKIDLQPA